MFRAASGIDIQHVPYKGSAPAVTDLIGGQIQLMFDPLQSVLSNIQGGKILRAGALQQGALGPLFLMSRPLPNPVMPASRPRHGGAYSRRQEPEH